MNNMVAKKGTVVRSQDEVDLTSEDSFPASDPPSWTPVVGTGIPCRTGRRSRVVDPAARDEAPAPQITLFKPGVHPRALQEAAEVLATRLELPNGSRLSAGRVDLSDGNSSTQYGRERHRSVDRRERSQGNLRAG
jgi:hypothetical protein